LPAVAVGCAAALAPALSAPAPSATARDRPRDRVQRPAGASRRFTRLPRDREPRSHIGIGIENQVDDLQRGKPIDERMMDLAHHPHPAVLESRDQGDLPQRPRPIQRNGQDLRAQRLESRIAHPLVRIRERDDVDCEIEVGVIDPARL